MKVSIIGMGKVGSALALTLVTQGMASELVLVASERSRGAAEGEALDLLHASAFTRPAIIRAGDVAATVDSDVTVVCAALPAPMGNRLNGLQANARLFQEIIPALAEASPHGVMLVTSNPLDAMTTLALRYSKLPSTRVMGTGTFLDTMRLRVLLSQQTGVHPQDIRAYVLGEHGDTQFAAIAGASMGGAKLPLTLERLVELESQTRNAGHNIVRKRGYSNHGVAMAAGAIIRVIAQDSHEVIPVCTSCNGFAGVEDVCLSLPAIVGRQGIVRTLPIDLTQEERRAFQKSADVVKGMLAGI